MTTTMITNALSGLQRNRFDGGLLIGTTCIAVVAMMHHPQVAAHSVHDVLEEIREKAVLDRVVHGSLMLLVAAQALAYYGIAYRRGLGRILMQCWVVFYSVGFLFVLHAALIDGFIIPELASVSASPAGDEVNTLSLLNLCGVTVRTATAAGMVATSAGFVFWCADLLRRPDRRPLLAAVGIVLNAALIATVLSGFIRLNLHGAFVAIVLHGCWNIAVGIVAWREVQNSHDRPALRK